MWRSLAFVYSRLGRPGLALRAIDWVAVGVILTITIWHAANPSELVWAGRDGSTYRLSAEALLDNGSIWIPMQPDSFADIPGVHFSSAGFNAVPELDVLLPQFSHGPAVFFASGGPMLASMSAVAGGLGLLAMYAFGALWTGRRLALSATVAMGVSLPYLYFARGTFSEPLTMLMLFGGFLFWARACQSPTKTSAIVAGVAIASATLVRIDALLLLIPLGAWLVTARFRGEGWPDSKSVSRGFIYTTLFGFLDLGLLSAPYLGGQIYEVVLILGGSVAAAVGLSVITRNKQLMAWLGRSRRGLAAGVLAGVIVATAFAFFVRPACCPGTFEASPVIAQTQAEVGEPIDASRSYSELSVFWLSWYVGHVVVALGLVGIGVLAAKTVRGKGSSDLLAFLVVGAMFVAVYLWRPSITADHIWAMRRFVPLVLPVLLLSAVWLAREAINRLPMGQGIAVVVTGLTVVSLAALPARPWLGFEEWRGAEAQRSTVCDTLDGVRVLLIDQEERPLSIFVAQSLRGGCEIPVGVVDFEELEPDELASIVRQADAPLWVVSASPLEDMGIADGSPVVDLELIEMERTLFEPPDELRVRGFTAYGVLVGVS